MGSIRGHSYGYDRYMYKLDIYIFLRTICALLQIKSSTIFVALSMKHNILYEQIDKWRIVTNSISYNDSTVA